MDAALVKSNAAGQWGRIISSLCKVDESLFSGDHQPCPKCGGRDRFRCYDDFGQTGGVICNQCARDCADGIATVQWLTGRDFKTSLNSIAEFLGVKSSGGGKTKRVKADPQEHLTWLSWNDSIVDWWCQQKPPITKEAVLACGGRLATYRRQYSVIAFPVFGELLMAADPVGWVLYATSGAELPKWDRDKKIEMVKCKLTSGSQPGFLINQTALGLREKWPDEVWKLEGVTDLLTAATISPRFPAFTNANGTDENPKHWWGELCKGRKINVLHDADKPGQTGATKTAKFLARNSSLVRILELPYEISESHGKDFRDFACEHGTNCYEHLKRMIDNGRVATAIADNPQSEQSVVNEHPDDPHRLARINLAVYRQHTGGDLKFYREQWFKWKSNRYQQIEVHELKAKTRQTIKSEFDRIYFEKREDFTRRVTNQIVNNVVAAMESYCVVSGNVEMPIWMEGKKRESRNYVAMTNGLVDLEQLLSGDIDNCLYPHSPNWFSTFCLDYEFDPSAECPQWMKVLNRNLEGDKERIAILQEWAGYLFSSRNDMQKFLCLEGEGANGKSVFLAVMEAMLGRQNCSYVPLESFGGRFDLSSTTGKQANICADVGQIDSVCEGRLKSFTSGDPMTFDRKGLNPIEDSPTAKLMLAWNNRPRIGDSSSGPWRRMILIPFRVQIQEHEMIRGMDKAKWWKDSGELPGIFLWAIQGLARLRSKGRFARSDTCAALIEEYKTDSNPVLSFFDTSIEEAPVGNNEESNIEFEETSDDLYGAYRKWCSANGHHPFASNKFFVELRRRYRRVKRGVSSSAALGRKRCYVGVRLIRESIFND